jgi:hypothetical protein
MVKTMQKETYIPLSIIVVSIGLIVSLSSLIHSVASLENRFTKIESKLEMMSDLSKKVETWERSCFERQ